MRVWYILMAMFITLMIALALLLGSLDDLRENHQVMLSYMDGIYHVLLCCLILDLEVLVWQIINDPCHDIIIDG